MHTDVTGQPGGPHPDEQARVDEEQRLVLAAIRKRRADEAEAERNAGTDAPSKIERAQQRGGNQADAVKALIGLVADLTKRIEVLEKRNG